MNSKLILGMWPSLSAFSVLFMRAVFSSLVMIPQALYANKGLADKQNLAGKPHMHLLSPRTVPPFHLLCAIICIMYEDSLTFIMFKILSLAEIEVFLNIGQIATVFIGALVLKDERLSIPHVLKVVIMFIGVLLIILGK